MWWPVDCTQDQDWVFGTAVMRHFRRLVLAPGERLKYNRARGLDYMRARLLDGIAAKKRRKNRRTLAERSP